MAEQDGTDGLTRAAAAGGRQWVFVGRLVGGAAAAGAILGWALSGIDLWARTSAARQCGEQHGICFGNASFVGVVAGVGLAVAVCWVGAAVLGARPLGFSVPLAVALTFVVIGVYLRTAPGGRLAPAGIVAAELAVTFGLLALAYTAGLQVVRITAGALLAALLVVAFAVSGPIHDHVQNNSASNDFTHLGVPLLAPNMPEYRMSAIANWTYLITDFSPKGSSRLSASPPVFEVLVVPIPAGFDPPRSCLTIQPLPDIPAVPAAGPLRCSPAGPNRWVRSDADAVQLIERQGAALVEAGTERKNGGIALLTRALDTLRPTTAAELADES